jgi:exodeoxyribonuclease-5
LKSNKTFFTLAGYAGVGKSSLLHKILKEYRGGVVVSAPTHKAKRVVSLITNSEGQTLQALLGLRPNVLLEEYNPNAPIFAPIAIPKINDYNFCIIDEASMLNQALFDLIVEKTSNRRVKVLFVGDYAQLPPVGEIKSPVFFNPDIEMHELTKIERQSDTNPLCFIYDNLRNNLDEPDGGFLRKSSINNIGEGIYFTLDKLEFRDLVLKKFSSEEFKNDINFCKLIAWRNETISYSNKFIREKIVGKDIPIIEVGDVIMGYRTITNKSQNYNIIENSADYKITERDGLMINKYGISGYYVTIREDLSNNKYKYERIFVVNTYDEANAYCYGELHDIYRDQAKNNKKLWNVYYDFRRDNVILTNITKHRNGEYRGSNDVIVKDLDYGFACTIHRAQGSTFNHVFCLETDINANTIIREKNKLKYVAFTRPTTSAVVLTSRIDE